MATKVKEKPAKVEADEESEEEFDAQPGESGHFTREELDEQWQLFAQQQKDAGKDQASITLKEPYELHDNKIIITLSNDVLKITFDRIKADLQGFLRTNLKNGKIILEAIVTETAQEDMIYTNKEKFTHLAKKHPALKELQEKLGLDPDY